MSRPPVLRQLLAEPEYRDYLKRKPALVLPTLKNPWQVWGLKGDKGRAQWRSRLCSSYDQAYSLTRRLYGDHDYLDLCIVSRSVLYPFPDSLSGLWSVTSGWTWCCRCRRPSTFRYMPEGHRALKSAPALTTDETFRCYYCGARKTFSGEEMR